MEPEGYCRLICVLSKDILKSLTTMPTNVTLFGNRFFAYVVKLTRGQPQLGWALIQYGWFPCKKTEMQGGECHVKTQRCIDIQGRQLYENGGRE